MANMTDALEIELLNGLLGVIPYASPATVYLALFTADPTDTGDVANEVSGGSYARVSLAGKFSVASGTSGESANTADITFATATADWGTVTHIGVMKSGVASTDDMIIHRPLVNPVDVLNGEVFEFLAGKLTLIAK